jgi:hypothetical protein
VRKRLKKLAALYDPAAICYGLAEVLIEQQQPCKHDYSIVRSQLAEYAPDVDADAVVAELEALGYHCDCEVGYNLCAELGV